MKKTMARNLGAAVVLSFLLGTAASAATLLKDDFSGTAFKGVGSVYIQGTATDTTAPFEILDGELNGGNSDGCELLYLMLTGDKSWADVSVTSKIRINGQNTGVVGLVLRAKDASSFYELRYTTGKSRVMADEEASGIAPPETDPNLRIMKVVNGDWKILAEADADVPAINAAGDLNAEGAVFRFSAKGDVLQGFVSIDGGKKFAKLIEAKDASLKAGLIGLDVYDYAPMFDDLVVESL